MTDTPPPRTTWQRVRDELVWWLDVIVNLGYELGRLARRSAGELDPWIESFPEALRTAQREVTASATDLARRDVPVAAAWVRPRAATAARATGRAAVTTALVSARAGWHGARAGWHGARAGWRGARAATAAGAPLGRKLSVVAGRVAWHTRPLVLVALALAIAGWVVPGPVLDVASRAVSSRLDEPGEAFGELTEPSVVLAADGSRLARLSDGTDRRVVALDDIPAIVRELVVVAEDRRFWDHEGYDMEAIGRAVLANVREGGVVQGGSTITQQLAKQNLVGDDDSVTRKATEAAYAVALEERFSKAQLLERYLNQVYFGSRAYGIAAAAKEYFGVDLDHLSAERAALLVGVIRSPSSLDPRRAPDAALARRNAVLGAAVEEGVLPARQARALQQRPLEVVPAKPDVVREPGVVEAVRRQFVTDRRFGETRAERARLLQEGGLRIETTIDPRLQDAARAALAAHLDGGPAGALAALEPSTGRVRALVDTVGDGSFDLASRARRQPGSAFKPFVAAAALANGVPPDRTLPGDGPLELEYAPGLRWKVENFGGSNNGPVDLRRALVKSVNTAFAQLGVELGVDRIADVLGRTGIDVGAALGAPDERGPSVALGGVANGVSPMEMAGAYGTFANGGRHAPTTLIERVVDRDGRVLFTHPAEAEPAIDPAVNTTLAEMLREVVAEGTGTRARLDGLAPIGKTGTTQDSADAWFVGAVPSLSAAVWIGHPDARVAMPGSTGGEVAAPIWRAFAAAALGA